MKEFLIKAGGAVVARLNEPSTWAGLGVLWAVVSSAASSGDWSTAAPAIVGAAFAVFKGEQKAA